MLILFVKATLVLAGACALCRVYRRAPAATVHLVWVLAFAALLALPPLSFVLPALRLPLPSLWHSADSTTVLTSQVFAGVNPDSARSGIQVDWLLLVWLFGAFAALVPVLLGAIHVRRIARRATPFPGKSRIFLCDREIMPMVWGLRRPAVLLPASARHWPAEKLRIVLLHEMAHIERRDLWTQILSHIVTAIYWFHPLAWWASRQMRRHSEMACDDRVLEAGIKPSDYASELLEVARSLAWRKSWSRAALAMARPSNLEGRLLAILDARSRSVRRSQIAAAAIVLVALAVPAAALQFGEREATGTGVAGNIYDISGGLVPGAAVSLSGPRGTQQTIAANGSFTFDGLPPGPYRLEIQKPGFAPGISRFHLAPDRRQQQDVFLKLGSVHERLTVSGQAPDVAPGTQPMRIRVGGNVQAAKIIEQIKPVYPRSAKLRRVTGKVMLRAGIQKDGTVGNLAVIASPDDDLTNAALDAVKQWRYSTTLLNGNPVEVETYIDVNFTLRR